MRHEYGQACRVLGISEATRVPVAPALRFDESGVARNCVVASTTRLKQLLGQAELDKAALREVAEGNF